jgi:hypothetical protein
VTRFRKNKYRGCELLLLQAESSGADGRRREGGNEVENEVEDG